ncbi:MAG: rRNA pseudouridine synthase [Clostridiales bacterium]|nr:rRNA pseudouridine synthase [Clostridiales bacterium]
MTNETMRLQKYLSECGVASRRKAEEMIEAGQVWVNGRKASIGDKVDPKSDSVTVKGKKVYRQKEQVYVMLNKPRGFITTMSDEMDRKCVAQLVEDVGAPVYPVGRLDRESEGLLLFTNDGEFANLITHPRRHISKTYRVTVRPGVSEEQITKLSTSVMVDGRMTAPAKVNIIEKQEGRVVLEMVIFEGRNRQIRKMCEKTGLEVARLKRTAIGSLKLGMLQPGKWRALTEDEIHRLTASASQNPSNE